MALRWRCAVWSRKPGAPAGDKDRVRRGQEAAYRFMSAIAGDQPHYEDAIRALFADDAPRFENLIAAWPADVRDHTRALAETAFDRAPPARTG